jgi:hypothetical protein
MTRGEERLQLESAVAADLYNMDLRKVLADWLEEYGTREDDPEEAVRQRNWTTEKQHCLDYLQTVASDLELEYQDLLDYCANYLHNGDEVVFGFDLPASLYDKSKFWHAYETVTDVKIEDETKKHSTFFRCAC